MNRIEITAIIKSALEGGHPVDSLDATLTTCAALFQKHATEAAPAAPAAAAPRAAATAAPVGGTHTITAVGLEDHGNRMRVTMDGVPGTKYATAWDKDAAAFRQGGQGAKYEVTLIEKPNPKGGRPFVNLKDVRLVAATAAAQDIPF